MRSKILLTLCLLTACSIFSQDCPEPKTENYKKVMSSAFAKDYKDCPVTIEGVYFKEGYANGYRKPKKVKKMYFFQCTNSDGNNNSNALTNEESGDFFVIEKDKADTVIEFQKGDKLKITGTTFIQNYFGMELSVFFIVSDIEKIE
ncbi:hypothetical protein [Costertonia aggregata]|uniref:Uncharacterized protein n=1 Tax=Costertonia aggregata TaxID=343403 RepID=A0A7H9ASF9_9FLAO|nr:hypothetical protein [Costertonia aggregata]QLG46393.1 hypothetical protein HYG79_13895 [Costertonia aggregata]